MLRMSEMDALPVLLSTMDAARAYRCACPGRHCFACGAGGECFTTPDTDSEPLRRVDLGSLETHPAHGTCSGGYMCEYAYSGDCQWWVCAACYRQRCMPRDQYQRHLERRDTVSHSAQ